MDGLSCDTSPKAQQTYKTTAFWLVWNLALDTFHHKESETKAIGNIQWAENPKSKTAKGAGHGLQSQFDVQSQCSCGKFAPKTKLQTLQCMLPQNVILDHLHLLNNEKRCPVVVQSESSPCMPLWWILKALHWVKVFLTIPNLFRSRSKLLARIWLVSVNLRLHQKNYLFLNILFDLLFPICPTSMNWYLFSLRRSSLADSPNDIE